MIDNYDHVRSDLQQLMQRQGVVLEDEALKPLRRIDFSKMVGIYDHEERFLRDVFVKSLMDAHQARIKTSRGANKLNLNDVRTAMLMLGSAVANADERKFSQVNKSVIVAICPYC